MTATASLALPSAVSPSTRTQSHLSQASASFGRTWPHKGHSIVSAETGGSKVGASVYSTVPPRCDRFDAQPSDAERFRQGLPFASSFGGTCLHVHHSNWDVQKHIPPI